MSKKEWLIIAAVAVVGVLVTGRLLSKKDTTITGMDHNKMSMNDSNLSYAVNLMSGKSYTSSKPTTLRFDIEQNGKAFKSFAIDSTKLMHLIVVRSDRSNFQHVHPTYDDKTGMFKIDNFQFPTDGQYRVFANFATTNAKKDMMGIIETQAPYVDVNVGDKTKVTTSSLGADSLSSTASGLTAIITTAPGGDSPRTTAKPTFYAGQDSTVEVAITKNGAVFKNLQEYLGNLGHIVILGPNLEFIHAHPMLGDVNSQTGYIPFMVTFPKVGQYKLFLQTQADNKVSTFGFNVTVQQMPKSTGNDKPMQGMDHMSH